MFHCIRKKSFETAGCDFFSTDEFVSHAKVTRGGETYIDFIMAKHGRPISTHRLISLEVMVVGLTYFVYL